MHIMIFTYNINDNESERWVLNFSAKHYTQKVFFPELHNKKRTACEENHFLT